MSSNRKIQISPVYRSASISQDGNYHKKNIRRGSWMRHLRKWKRQQSLDYCDLEWIWTRMWWWNPLPLAHYCLLLRLLLIRWHSTTTTVVGGCNICMVQRITRVHYSIHLWIRKPSSSHLTKKKNCNTFQLPIEQKLYVVCYWADSWNLLLL